MQNCCPYQWYLQRGQAELSVVSSKIAKEWTWTTTPIDGCFIETGRALYWWFHRRIPRREGKGNSTSPGGYAGRITCKLKAAIYRQAGVASIYLFHLRFFVNWSIEMEAKKNSSNTACRTWQTQKQELQPNPHALYAFEECVENALYAFFERMKGCVVEGKMYTSNAAASWARDAERPGLPSSLTADCQLPLLRSSAIGGEISCSSALLLHTTSNGWASAKRLRSTPWGTPSDALTKLRPDAHLQDHAPRFVRCCELLSE